MIPTLASSQSPSHGPALAHTPTDLHLVTSMGTNDAQYTASGRGNSTSSKLSYCSSRKRRLSDSSDTKWSNKRPRTSLFGTRAASDPCVGTSTRPSVDGQRDSDFRVDNLLPSSAASNTYRNQDLELETAYFSPAARDAGTYDNMVSYDEY